MREWSHSTAELLPLSESIINKRSGASNAAVAPLSTQVRRALVNAADER
jgi:hypothetical protein